MIPAARWIGWISMLLLSIMQLVLSAADTPDRWRDLASAAVFALLAIALKPDQEVKP